MNRLTWHRVLPIALVIVIQIPLVIPFFHHGFFPTHDNVQVHRVFEMYQSLRFGSFPAHWQSGLLYGYGYPLFTFYPPLAYWLGALVVFAGFSFLFATKVVFIACFFLGGIGIYLLGKHWFGTLSGLGSAIIFSFVPYRAVDVYVRGNLAEFLAHSLLPWIMLCNRKLYDKERSSKYSIAFGLLLAVLILTHTISMVLYVGFLVICNCYFLLTRVTQARRVVLLKLGISLLIAATTSCFYWLPLLYESQFVKLGNFAKYPASDYLLTLPQLWNSAWGYGGLTEINPMSVQLGKVLIVLSLTTMIINSFIKTRYRSLLFFIGGLGLLLTLFELKLALPLWQHLPMVSFMQFPWRIHVLMTFLGSLLVGGLVCIIGDKFHRLAPYVLIIIFISATYESLLYFRPKVYEDVVTFTESTTWNDEYMPKWVVTKPTEYPADKIRFIDGTGKINAITWGYLQKSFDVIVTQSTQVQIAHIYYPGWQATLDSNPIPITIASQSGLMQISAPSGRHIVVFSFHRTWWRIVSEIVSVSALVAVVFSVLIKIIWKKN